MDLTPETLFVAAYAVVLLVAAACLDLLARHSHRRAGRFRTAGFTYHAHLDAWECAQGEQLHQIETDYERRLVRYRARAHVCNACLIKEACTDSDEGREIAQPLDPWPHSEAGRFHRGIALVLCALAIVLPVAEFVRHHAAADVAVLVGVLLLGLLETVHFGAVFLATPSGAPPTDARVPESPFPRRLIT